MKSPAQFLDKPFLESNEIEEIEKRLEEQIFNCPFIEGESVLFEQELENGFKISLSYSVLNSKPNIDIEKMQAKNKKGSTDYSPEEILYHYMSVHEVSGGEDSDFVELEAFILTDKDGREIFSLNHSDIPNTPRVFLLRKLPEHSFQISNFDPGTNSIFILGENFNTLRGLITFLHEYGHFTDCQGLNTNEVLQKRISVDNFFRDMEKLEEDQLPIKDLKITKKDLESVWQQERVAWARTLKVLKHFFPAQARNSEGDIRKFIEYCLSGYASAIKKLSDSIDKK